MASLQLIAGAPDAERRVRLALVALELLTEDLAEAHRAKAREAS